MPITKQWPGGATNATPTSFSLPLNNELNWLQLTSFLQSLADSAQGTTFQKFKVRVVTASPDTISATADCILAVNVAGAVTINLPAGAEKQIFFIVDSSGAAATNNITITPNGSETVRGGASLVLNKNYQGVVLAFTGTDWKAFGPFTTPGSITDADFTGQLSTAKGGTGQNSTATFPTSGTVATVPAAGVVKSSGTALTSGNVDLTSEVTGTLPIANGGTGITSFGTGVQTALGQNVTGTGSIVLSASPTLSGNAIVNNIQGTGANFWNYSVTGTGANGYIQMTEQSVPPGTPASNNVRLYLKTDNNLYLKDELGIEYSVGGQFTWILNQIVNSSESDNWQIVGGTVSTTTIAAQLPLTPIIGTAIRYVPTSNTHYVRYRWTMAAPFASQRMRLYFAYITSAVASGDFVVEVYTNTLANYTGTYTKVALDSDVAGVSALAAGTSFYESTFVADASLVYYEIRFVRVTVNASAINLAAVTVSPMLVSYGLGAAAGKSLSLNATGGSGYLEIAEQSSSPATPSSGFARIYPKTDNKLYLKDDTGVETQLGAGGVGEINVVENPSDANNWGTSNATVTTTTTAADLPLGPLVDTAIEIASSTSGGYARYRWTMPVSLRQRKLKVAWQQVAATLTSGDYKVEVYKNSASDYSGSYTEFSLSTDSSGTSSIPNLNGQYQTTFDSDDGIYYELRVVRTAASSATIRLAGVTVGPGIQPQGAVIEEWNTYTPTVTNLGSGSGTALGRYRRVGTNVEIIILFTKDGNAGSGGAGVTFSLPSGLTLNSTIISNNDRWAVGVASSTAYTNAFSTNVSLLSNNVLRLGTPNSDLGGSAFTANSMWSMQALIPIAEWSGSGTVQLAQNDVEYAWNSSTSTSASDSTSFGYGPSGAQIQNITAIVVRRVRFNSPIQAGDSFSVEVSTDRVKWLPINNTISDYVAWQVTPYFQANTSATYGIGNIKIINNTDIEVSFGGYASAYSATTWGGAGNAWSAGAGSLYWRVRKSSAGAAVGFGVVNSVSTGLVTPMSAQTALTLTASTPTATIVRAVGIAYTDIGGIWRLRFNASWTVASASRALASVTFSGVTFKNVANFAQAFSASTSAGGIATVGYCTVNTGTINVEHATATTTAYYVSGDVELESKPTWA